MCGMDMMDIYQPSYNLTIVLIHDGLGPGFKPAGELRVVPYPFFDWL